MKKFCAPTGRIQEQIDRLPLDVKSRAAKRSSMSMFGDDCVQIWPSRAAMLKTVDMQRRGPPRSDHWRPLVKREGIDGSLGAGAARMKPTPLWIAFRKRYGLRDSRIPDSGYCVSLRGGQKYDTCFVSKARGRQGAQLLADAACADVYLVEVRNRGEDRSIVDEARPRRCR